MTLLLMATGRAIRDSMFAGWLLLGALVLALVFAIRVGITWWASILLGLAVPMVVLVWARALCRLERRANETPAAAGANPTWREVASPRGFEPLLPP